MDCVKTVASSLVASAPNADGRYWTHLEDHEETCQSVGRAFAGDPAAGAEPEPTGLWSYKACITEEIDQAQFTECKITEMRFALGALPHGYEALQLREKDGSVCATMVLEVAKRETDNSFLSKMMSSVTDTISFATMLAPMIWKSQINFGQVAMSVYNETMNGKVLPMMQGWAKTYGSEDPYCHLYMMAVTPESVGKGVGKTALGGLSDVCDEQGVMLYLECGKRLSTYYERFGYQVVDTQTLLASGEDQPREDAEFCCMIRPKKM